MSWLSKTISKAVPAADTLFGPKSWKIGAGIGAGALLFKGLKGGPGTAAGGFSLGSLLPSVIGAGADIYAAKQIAEGQEQANISSLESAREQMAFQERMSSTAHQREVEDLRAAGLNPVLSANSGSSTPVGASIEYANEAPNFSNIGGRAVATAMEIKRLNADLAEIRSRVELNKAEAANRKADAEIKKPGVGMGQLLERGVQKYGTSAKSAREAMDELHREFSNWLQSKFGKRYMNVEEQHRKQKKTDRELKLKDQGKIIFLGR